MTEYEVWTTTTTRTMYYVTAEDEREATGIVLVDPPEPERVQEHETVDIVRERPEEAS